MGWDDLSLQLALLPHIARKDNLMSLTGKHKSWFEGKWRSQGGCVPGALLMLHMLVHGWAYGFSQLLVNTLILAQQLE